MSTPVPPGYTTAFSGDLAALPRPARADALPMALLERVLDGLRGL